MSQAVGSAHRGSRRFRLAVSLVVATCWLAALVPANAAEVADCGDGVAAGAFPVVVVHGFNQKAGDLTWFGPVKSALLGAGTTPHFFDYGPSSRNWVTDPQIGPRLTAMITCLAAQSKAAGGPGQVGLIAHSMGGLAVRSAIGNGVVDPATVAFVVTVATPHNGAFFSKSLTDLFGPTLGSLLAAACDGNSGWFCDQVAAANSPAANAMASGSDELGSLPWFPAGPPVHAVGGEMHICDALLQYSANCLNGNDPLVPLDSSIATGHNGVEVAKRTDCEVPLALVAIDLANSLRHIPCSHGALMLTDTTTSTVISAVDKWRGDFNDSQKPLDTASPDDGFPRSITGDDVRQRAEPSLGGQEVGDRLARGTQVRVTCQAVGEMVPSAGGRVGTEDGSNVWDKLTSGAYVSDLLVDTKKDVDSNHEHLSYLAWDSEIPVCGTSHPPEPTSTPSTTIQPSPTHPDSNCDAPPSPNVNWSYCNKLRAKLSGANLSGANLTHTFFHEADLSGANLTGADLSEANLSGANLSGAILTGVNWYHTECPNNSFIHPCVP